MAKKKRCPYCSGKMTKVRNKQERQCKECGHKEPMLLVQTDQEKEKLTESILEPPVTYAKNAKLTVDGKEIQLDPIPKPVQVADQDHINRMKRKRPPGDFINKGMMALQKVTVHCWSRGLTRGFKYGLNCPYPNTVWSKEMSGVEAFKFLSGVKKSNRKKKLETSTIMEFDAT